MHVLIVLCHPTRQSFCGAILDRYCAGLVEGGHSFEIADLYAENFCPVFEAGDYVQFQGGTLPDQIIREQERVERCDALAFVSPIWWLGLPAMLKGWFDRVWSNGWAYAFSNNPEGSLLPERPFLFLLTAGGSRSVYRTYGYDVALETVIRVGILDWCGVSESALVIFHDTGFGDEAGRGHLRYVERLARSATLVGDCHEVGEYITVLRRPIQR
jgi:NAD(P)H dehydrogenase (quinone)